MSKAKRKKKANKRKPANSVKIGDKWVPYKKKKKKSTKGY